MLYFSSDFRETASRLEHQLDKALEREEAALVASASNSAEPTYALDLCRRCVSDQGILLESSSRGSSAGGGGDPVSVMRLRFRGDGEVSDGEDGGASEMIISQGGFSTISLIEPPVDIQGLELDTT